MVLGYRLSNWFVLMNRFLNWYLSIKDFIIHGWYSLYWLFLHFLLNLINDVIRIYKFFTLLTSIIDDLIYKISNTISIFLISSQMRYSIMINLLIHDSLHQHYPKLVIKIVLTSDSKFILIFLNMLVYYL
jgi:hypothetical protein